MKFFKTLLTLLFLVSTPSFALSIANTKHNLSISNTAGTIKATAEGEICVFCHIPHVARYTGKPLWNRNMPVSSYSMYDSDYLRRMAYPDVQSDLGVTNDTPGAVSRQCLSCHDGSVAIGAVYKLRRDVIDGTPIDMQNVAADGSIPTTSSAFLGTNLKVHHPVGIEYKPSVSLAFGSGSRPIELVADPTAASPIRLFDYGGTKYIECSSCHDPHKENGKFLRVDTEPTLGQNIVQTCVSCHDKVDWIGSVHQTQTAQWDASSGLGDYGTTAVGELGCLNCHMPHNAKGTPYINREFQANTCFSTNTLGPCHRTGGAKDIESVLRKTYAHPVVANSDEADTNNPKHTNLDALYGKPNPDPNGGAGLDWSTVKGKHAMCMDCHNPHKAKAGTHAGTSSIYGTLQSNTVSNVLAGVPGVEPTWPSWWTQPVTFTTLESATKEYQICLKCHSYWGLGSATNGVNNDGHISISDASVAMTDVAWEFNVNNLSGHPVVLASIGRPGSYAPQELTSDQMYSPWDTAVGTQTMYCSDCHGADQELNGDPRGPHGSNNKFMLKSENNTNIYWPADGAGNHYQVGASYTNADRPGLFCANCHDLLGGAAGGSSGPHNQSFGMDGLYCVRCHVAVPHGSPLSRLIGYSTFSAPYNYNGNMNIMTSVRKAVSYTTSDAYPATTAPETGDSPCRPHTSDPGEDAAPPGW